MTASRVTNRTDYAVRAVLYLSLQEAGRIVPIPEIASETGLSVKFLEEILLLLRRAGIVRSRRGKQGGYHLIKLPHEITVADVVQSLEGGGVVSLSDDSSSAREPYHKVTQQVFHSAAQAWWERLAGAKVSDLAEEVRRLSTEQDMYYI